MLVCMPLWCLLVAVQQACYGATLLLVASASIFDKQVRGVVEMQQLLWGGGSALLLLLLLLLRWY